MQKKYYVYVHRRASDGRPFYVGKGSGRRLTQCRDKSRWWKNIAFKHGWYPEKIYTGLSECCAYSIEKMLIHANASKLCNIHHGGLGGPGSKPKSKEHIAKVAAAQTGRPKSQETKEKISLKARERFSDKARHWHTTLILSRWVHKDGTSRRVATHLDMYNEFGGSLGGFKKAEGQKIKSYKGWKIEL